MTHPTLFPPATHAHDPTPSHMAELHVTHTGTRYTHCRQVLDMVRRYPGLTAVELQPWLGLERHEVSRRLSDLKSRGLIRIVGRRRCRAGGTVMSTWEVT